MYSLKAFLFKETKVRATKTEVMKGKGRNKKYPERPVGQKEVEVGEFTGLAQKTRKFSELWLKHCR